MIKVHAVDKDKGVNVSFNLHIDLKYGESKTPDTLSVPEASSPWLVLNSLAT